MKVSIAKKGDMPCGCGPKHGAYEEAESRDLMVGFRSQADTLLGLEGAGSGVAPGA